MQNIKQKYCKYIDKSLALIYNNNCYVTSVIERRIYMPPKIKITADEIIKAAIELVRESGIDALNARALAKRLNCSTQPIFRDFRTMDEIKQLVLQKAYEIYVEYIHNAMRQNDYPPYKASGMAYIRFANEERQLFLLLFMRDRSAEQIPEKESLTDELTELIAKGAGIDEKSAYRLQIEMWLLVHGIAAMAATNYLNITENDASDMLTHAYKGLVRIFKEEQK